jgi:hypothetical protein
VEIWLLFSLFLFCFFFYYIYYFLALFYMCKHTRPCDCQSDPRWQRLQQTQQKAKEGDRKEKNKSCFISRICGRRWMNKKLATIEVLKSIVVWPSCRNKCFFETQFLGIWLLCTPKKESIDKIQEKYTFILSLFGFSFFCVFLSWSDSFIYFDVFKLT